MGRRLLLINPAHVVDGQVRHGPTQFPIPPLNLGYVAALTPPGWEVRIIDENLRREDGLGWGADLVGLTALTPNAPRAYALAARYRAAGAAVVMGGVHASTLPSEAAQYVDSVVVGEAEGIWAQVVADFEAGALKPRYESDFLPLAGLPRPRRDLYPRGYFAETALTSKGCRYHCDFCAVWRFYGRRYRTRPVDEVVGEMATLGRHKLIFLADDNLTLEPERIIALCKALVRHGVRRRFAIQGSLNLADNDELLEWLRRAGCVYVFVGLESLNPDALRHIGKPDLLQAGAAQRQRRQDGLSQREIVAQRLARLHAHRLGVFGSFIVGLDEDTPETFEQLESFILETQIDCALINILNPSPGTDLWERLAGQGRLLYTRWPDDYVYYAQDNVCFRPLQLTPAELEAGTRRLIARINRPAQVLRRAWQTLRHTRSLVATLISLEWNRRSYAALRRFPLRRVRD